MVLATAGSAVGLGNVWRFPYMAGQNGGASFILIYIGCVLLLGIPCMMNEFIIGRHGASNTGRAYGKMGKAGSWRFIGCMSVLTGFIITSYYAVVSGWCLQYIFASAGGELNGDPQYISKYFQDFSSSPFRPMLWTIAILLMTHYVIIHGVRSGIERASKLMMPTLFLLLIVVVIGSCMLPGAGKGVEFLFVLISHTWIPPCSSQQWASRFIRSVLAWVASAPLPAISPVRPTFSSRRATLSPSTLSSPSLPD